MEHYNTGTWTQEVRNGGVTWIWAAYSQHGVTKQLRTSNVQQCMTIENDQELGPSANIDACAIVCCAVPAKGVRRLTSLVQLVYWFWTAAV